MKFEFRRKVKKKKGFTLLESLIYIFITTLILSEGMHMTIVIYNSYLNSANLTLKYNNIQNFYISLDNIISEGNLKELIVGDDYLVFSKDEDTNNLDKTIKVNGNKVIVKYSRGKDVLTSNNMLFDVEKIKVKEKENLIYLILYDKDGKEFISCL